jgi:predicted PurR-regulated permease PerM
MSNSEIFTIIIAVVSAGIAFWQGISAHKQVELSKNTNDETKRLLEDIKRIVEKVENVSSETKKDVENQVDKLIDNQNEHQKTLMGNLTNILSNFDPKVKSNDQTGQALLGALLNGQLDMDKMMKLAEMGNKFEQNKNNS